MRQLSCTIIVEVSAKNDTGRIAGASCGKSSHGVRYFDPCTDDRVAALTIAAQLHLRQVSPTLYPPHFGPT
jgi:hypothetical protein